jgi:hypothetical protein
MLDAYITCLSCETSDRVGSNHSLVEFVNKHSECGSHYSISISGLGTSVDFELFISSEFWDTIEEHDKFNVTMSTSQDIQKFFLKEVVTHFNPF